MPDSQMEFDQLMERVRGGSPDALERVCQLYGDHVRRVVRRRLHRRLRPQYDSIDFLQEVWASFYAVPPQRYTFPNATELIRFLARLACNKVNDVYRRKYGPFRNVQLEEPLDEVEDELAVAARQPTPSQLAIADESLQGMIDSLSPGQRQVVLLLRQGHTHEEIAAQLGTTPKTIQRLVRRLEQKLQP